MFHKAAIRQETKGQKWGHLHNRVELEVGLHANFYCADDYLVEGCGKSIDGSESFRSDRNYQKLEEGFHHTEWQGDWMTVDI